MAAVNEHADVINRFVVGPTDVFWVATFALTMLIALVPYFFKAHYLARKMIHMLLYKKGKDKSGMELFIGGYWNHHVTGWIREILTIGVAVVSGLALWWFLGTAIVVRSGDAVDTTSVMIDNVTYSIDVPMGGYIQEKALWLEGVDEDDTATIESLQDWYIAIWVLVFITIALKVLRNFFFYENHREDTKLVWWTFVVAGVFSLLNAGANLTIGIKSWDYSTWMVVVFLIDAGFMLVRGLMDIITGFTFNSDDTVSAIGASESSFTRVPAGKMR